ncbi:hypothetical protein BCT81_02785 [Vibrio sp. 10N.261.52.A1]|uniref:Uncharacterized protein n=1 Tax=Vibrio splendidus TaxID=29497 RepID=A0A2N7C982_VIBSP|nr:hypothetical protein BCV19_17810 [Vibrio splendidus]PML40335.1 hypothetical protein BCT81_02785 [Vibrio sp. 10N.261.52.A1]PML97130.1 hypothetical protein BCT66_02090 [Vibrio sp. 10N.261.49.E11]PMN81797.1 hypothetical protein BCT25_14115 [Vibrio sp. 10N.261.45.A6]PMN85852.1 hypothetical protein BCT22_09305 [Vibrio sp. 10N.261.45.A1]
MPITKPSLMNANLKRFMRKPKLRIEKAQSLEDLLNCAAFGVRCKMNKLSIKVKDGHLVPHQYTQGKTKP